ncbi:efflux transporter outer membrane subunit [Herbaspirillum autotrophicum]|uniref:efflux transporter outer membrane subunit n=1 Tax=Herbaspirillum autotrophicum TaxID=180195 RepID=UPI00067ACB69|nr:efflux transporter outer membrane subunit [Herbaspirillum autotrophicum]
MSDSRFTLSRLRPLPWLLLAAIVTGCSGLPSASDQSAPATPAAWRTNAGAALSPSPVDQQWWQSFGSTELNAVVVAARQQSLDVAAASARVRQAEAQARIAGAPLLPELALTASANRDGRFDSGNTAFGNTYSAGLAATYEVDFWGRNRAVRDAAVATLQAAAFERDTVRLTVTAGVASVWLSQQGLQARLLIAQANLSSAERILELVAARQRAGAATPLELAQQRGLVAAQRRAAAVLTRQIRDSESALAVLLATPLTALQQRPRAGTFEQLTEPAISAMLPSDLLLRRPDIARAEADLAAADANISAARAAMLPRLNLSAAVGLGSNRLNTVFDNPLYSLAAGLTAPIFNAGRLAAGRDLARAQREELLAVYRASIIAAFADVEDALNAVASIDTERRLQQDEVTQARTAFALAQARYRAGAETLLTLLDTQRTLYAAQDVATQLQQARLQASVALFKALGGGWQPPAS